MEFGENRSILSKKYPEDCIFGESNQRPIIMITYDKNTFLANDKYQKVQTLDNYRILQLKSKRKNIIVLDFFLLWSYFNLASLLLKKQKNIAELDIPFKATTYFEYKKIK